MPRFNSLSLGFLADRPGAAARVLQSQPARDTAQFLEDIPLRILAPVLTAMETWPAARLLPHMATVRAAAILTELDYRQAVALLRLQQDSLKTALLAALPERLARAMKKTLAFQDNRVGALMDMSAPFFKQDLAIGDCLELLGRSEEPFGTTLTVVDSSHRVTGVASLDSLLVGPRERTLAQVADTSVAVLSAEMSLHHAMDLAAWHRYPRLPVVGKSQTYLGALSREALGEAMEQDRREAVIDTSLAAHLATAMVSACAGLVQPTVTPDPGQAVEHDHDH